MDKAVTCPACGEITLLRSCPSCGTALAGAAHAVAHYVATDEQTASDLDQTASDQDQTWSDHDQTRSDQDQRSADEDQHAADDDFAAGGSAAAYHRSAQAREQASRDRAAVAAIRDETASMRLRTAAERDRAAALRDRGAEGRDELARLHDLDDDADASREDILLRAARDRARAAADRAKAADDRARAAAEREQAARERAEMLQDRAHLLARLELSATDELTGARTRAFGLEEVSRELERARRTGASLALAFIDVDGLKKVNDSRGHLAGDELLRLVGETVRANVRRYDVLVRYGGDELLCAMPGLGTAEAKARFENVAAALSAVDVEHSITVGLAEAEPADTLEDLIARADAELLEARRRARSVE